MTTTRDPHNVAEWAELLNDLIRAGREEEDKKRRGEIADRLLHIIGQNLSTNSKEYALEDELDTVAQEAVVILSTQNIKEKVEEIAALGARLAEVRKKLDRATAEAQDKASSIRLENATRAITGATELVSSINAVRATLEKEDEEESKANGKLERAVKALQDARSAMELLRFP